jgi:hypothetical protein
MVKLIDGWLHGLTDNYFYFENSEPKAALLTFCLVACMRAFACERSGGEPHGKT